jgi:photosystem II stability/assembly factor-like uncharacterized protein
MSVHISFFLLLSLFTDYIYSAMKSFKLHTCIVLLIWLSVLISYNSVYSQFEWVKISMLNSTPSCFAFKDNGVMFTGTLTDGVFISTNGGYNWISRSQGMIDGHVYSLAINEQGTMYAGSESFGLYISTNEGISWQQTSLIVNIKIRSIVINQQGDIFAATSGHGIYKSTDNCNTWTNTSVPLYVNSLSVHTNGYLFAASRTPDVLYRSTDNGTSWVISDSGEHAYNAVQTAPNGNIFAITGNFITDGLIGDKIVRSTDNGDTWTVQYSFASSSYGMAINKLNHIFVGRYVNVYNSTDEGLTFTVLNTGLYYPNNEKVITLGCDSAGYVFLGQELGAVYRSNWPTIGIKKTVEEIPDGYKLYQNYPNPFNPTTIIKFEITNSTFVEDPACGEGGKGDVKLVIYDLTGKAVEILIDKEMKAGSYSVDWNGANYSSGIYFYSLLVNGSPADTKKMILIK